MTPIGRRRALQLGFTGAAASIVGAGGLIWTFTAPFDPAGGATLTEPPALRSSGGALEVRLEAALGAVTLAGRTATTLSYNGGVPGPTLYLKPGDRLQVELVNRLTEPTNLHVHGLHVSPSGNSDNPFVTVAPGESFKYDYRLPADHRSGMFWYHPHHHGTVADQVFGGLYGAIVVEDSQPMPVTAQRVLVISDISLDASGRVQPSSAMEKMIGREGRLLLVNGQSGPHLQARPGQRERWRVVNACTSRYLRLRLDGQHLQLLGVDAGRFAAPRDVEEVVLVPGNRADLLISATAGSSSLQTIPYGRGGLNMMGGTGAGGPNPTGDGAPAVLATLDVSGAPAAIEQLVPDRVTLRDLRQSILIGRRTLTLAAGMGMGMMNFTIDGEQFDSSRINQKVRLGSIEEWTITNNSPMDHPFHLHVWPMQIIEQAARSEGTPRWQDVVNVPARSSTKVRIAFDDFPGRTVYHCHILDHEDRGMMGIVEVR